MYLCIIIIQSRELWFYDFDSTMKIGQSIGGVLPEDSFNVNIEDSSNANAGKLSHDHKG